MGGADLGYGNDGSEDSCKKGSSQANSAQCRLEYEAMAKVLRSSPQLFNHGTNPSVSYSTCLKFVVLYSIGHGQIAEKM